METRDLATISLTASHDIESDSYISDEHEGRPISGSPPPPPPPLPSHSRRLIVTHARHGRVNREVQSGAAFHRESDEESIDSRHDYNRQFCDSEESEPPRYHSLNTVPHMHHYTVTLPRDASVEAGNSKRIRVARPASPARLPAPTKPMIPPGAFWRKQQQMSCSTDNSYRSIQESVRSPHQGPFTRREAAQQIADRNVRNVSAYSQVLWPADSDKATKSSTVHWIDLTSC